MSFQSVNDSDSYDEDGDDVENQDNVVAKEGANAVSDKANETLTSKSAARTENKSDTDAPLPSSKSEEGREQTLCAEKTDETHKSQGSKDSNSEAGPSSRTGQSSKDNGEPSEAAKAGTSCQQNGVVKPVQESRPGEDDGDDVDEEEDEEEDDKVACDADNIGELCTRLRLSSPSIWLPSL